MIDTQWYDEEQTILYVKFPSEWTWSDYDTGIRRIRQMIQSEGCLMDCIVNMRASATLPEGVAYEHIYRGRVTVDPQFRMFVFVGASDVLQGLISVINHVHQPAQKSRYFVETLDDALELIMTKRDLYAHN